MVSGLASIATGIGLGIGYGILSEYARYAILYAKWKAMMSNARHKVAEVLDSLLEGEKDPLTGLSAKGQVDTIIEFIDKTIDFIGIVDESLASQMFIQMIQQSIAYAINASHAGAIGTLANVYSGSTYLSPAESQAIGEHIDRMDRYSRAFLSAETGTNIPTLTFNLMRGGERRLEEVYRSLMSDINSLVNEWNDLAMMYYRHYHSMARTRLENALEMKESLVDRAYSLLEQVANEHLARINEMLDTVEGAKAWFDAGLLSENEVIDICMRVDLERQASEADYNEYKDALITAIENGITEWDNYVSNALNDLEAIEYRYMLLLRSIFDKLFNDVADFVMSLANMIENTVEDVCAYRNTSKTLTVSRTVTEFTPPPIGYNIAFDDEVESGLWTIKFYNPNIGFIDVGQSQYYPLYACYQRKIAYNHINGKMYLVYTDKDEAGKTRIYVIESSDNGKTWGNKTLVSTSPELDGYDAEDPSIAVDKHGNLHVVFRSKSTIDPTHYQIFYTKFDGSSWTTPVCVTNVSEFIGYEQFDALVLVDDKDRVHVIWFGNNSSFTYYRQLWHRYFDGVDWSSIIKVSDKPSMEYYDHFDPSAFVDKNGCIHVTWSGAEDGVYSEQIYYRKFDGESWGSIERVSIEEYSIDCYHPISFIEVDANGDVHVVYNRYEEHIAPHYEIWYNKRTSEGWNTPVKLSTLETMEYHEQDLPILYVTSGKIYAFWIGAIDGYDEYSLVFISEYNGSWSTPQILYEGVNLWFVVTEYKNPFS